MIVFEKNILDKLNDCCDMQGSKSIIFGFNYKSLNIRCIFFQSTQTILIGFAERSVAWQIDISDNRISEQIPNEVYRVINDLLKNSEEKYSNRPLFDSLLKTIESLELSQIENAKNNDIIGLLEYTKTRDKKYDKEGDKPYFNHWRRVDPSSESLYKIQRYFGKNVRESCWKNKVTAVFSENISPNSLTFLSVEDVEEEIEHISNLSRQE